ncbi:hypothetical protein [Mesobacillus harenae]|uniref:hypothetical protein n=1 Tax=Mesobacillus harenae TaxID=2213203 RepID=UPI0015801A15|nr:hypothetical protein [Mesobacillus harenae]
MKNYKQLLLTAAMAGQVIAIIMLFINIRAAIWLYSIYLILFLGVFLLLIKERRNEKKEDEKHDHSDY